MIKPIKKRFDFTIAQAGERVQPSFELESTITQVDGILLTSDKDDLLYYRGTQGIEINSSEIVPEGYESRLLMSGLNVKPSDRYYPITVTNVGNGLVEVDFTDVEDERAPFESYRVSIYLECQMDDGQ
jgi:hypothetical protein